MDMALPKGQKCCLEGLFRWAFARALANLPDGAARGGQRCYGVLHFLFDCIHIPLGVFGIVNYFPCSLHTLLLRSLVLATLPRVAYIWTLKLYNINITAP